MYFLQFNIGVPDNLLIHLTTFKRGFQKEHFLSFFMLVWSCCAVLMKIMFCPFVWRYILLLLVAFIDIH